MHRNLYSDHNTKGHGTNDGHHNERVGQAQSEFLGFVVGILCVEVLGRQRPALALPCSMVSSVLM